MENKDIKPFQTETAVVITDKSGNELNMEFYNDEIAMYGTYQAVSVSDEHLKSIIMHLQGIHDALPDNEDGEIPEDFKLTVQAGKKPPCFKVNFNIYPEDGIFKAKIATVIQKLQAIVDSKGE